jgi:hypothetical protein
MEIGVAGGAHGKLLWLAGKEGAGNKVSVYVLFFYTCFSGHASSFFVLF